MNWIHKWAIGIHGPEENPATTRYRLIRRQGVRAHLTPDDREGWSGVLSLFLRPFVRLRWIVQVGLSVVVRPGTAQELDLRPLPLPQGESLTSSSTASPPSPDAEEKGDPRPKSAHEDVQKGTSNARILWALPNFLTLENAKNVPPLTPGQKFKVTARGVFDPFEFVLIGTVAGINQAADSSPLLDRAWRGMGSATPQVR